MSYGVGHTVPAGPEQGLEFDIEKLEQLPVIRLMKEVMLAEDEPGKSSEATAETKIAHLETIFDQAVVSGMIDGSNLGFVCGYYKNITYGLRKEIQPDKQKLSWRSHLESGYFHFEQRFLFHKQKAREHSSEQAPSQDDRHDRERARTYLKVMRHFGLSRWGRTRRELGLLLSGSANLKQD